MVQRVEKKLIQSGDVIEIYEYSEGYIKGYTLTENEIERRKGFKNNTDDTDSRERSLRRAKTNLRRLINANVGQYGREFVAKFLTLTFRENIQDIKQANYEFSKFIKRLNYRLYGTKKVNLKYTTVIEFQKRGAIHYHTIIYNMPYLKADELSNIWGNGYIKINKIDDIDNVGAYVGEYLGKAEQGKDAEDDRLKGQKTYFSSKGLFKPLEITDKKIVEQVADALQNRKPTYTATYENEYLGIVTYKQYNIKS